MAIENIPEIVLIEESYPSGDFDFSKSPIEYDGKFIVFDLDGGSKYHVVSRNKVYQHSDLVTDFEGLLIKECRNRNPLISIEEFVEEFRRFSILGGGDLRINDERILVGGESGVYGRYDEKTVRPIVERWAERTLPNHTIKIA